jgi:3-mercaptopyruvate sulfurtransferase SseA
VALLLRRRGIERVRPLAGGYRAWRELGYPMTRLSTQVELTVATVELNPAAGVEPVVSGGVNA